MVTSNEELIMNNNTIDILIKNFKEQGKCDSYVLGFLIGIIDNLERANPEITKVIQYHIDANKES